MRATIRSLTATLRETGIAPRLAIVVVGDDAASRAYLRNLERTGNQLGIDVTVESLPAATGSDELRAHLAELGGNASVHGLFVAQPLPPHLAIRAIADAIPAHKDVDAVNPLNQGFLALGDENAHVPATPAAVMALLEVSPAWPLQGRNAVVIGRSNVVGLPVALLLLGRGATVTIVHRGTRDLAAHVRNADVIVAAAGQPQRVGAGMVRAGATVIDVGTTYVDGKLYGDVDFDAVREIAAAITPVPGGVGPVTNVALLRNVVDAAERSARN